MSLPGRTLNRSLLGPDGAPVVLVESLDVAAGHRVTFSVISVGERWRQGLFIATEGAVRIGDEERDQWIVWTDSAPPQIDVEIVKTDGKLVFYNIWDSGRSKGRESQSHTSGMYLEVHDDGVRRYACNDIGFDPDFTSLVFDVELHR